MRIALIASLLFATPAVAREAPRPERLRATVAALVGFGTRHSASSATDPVRGIGAARNWTAARFAEIGASCGGCITVERPSRRFVNARAANGVVIENVLGIQRGSDADRPGGERYVIVAGHIDSIPSVNTDAVSDAPGANDDASGVAVVLEAARILSREKFAATIVYAVFSGEEQGLLGATFAAETAKARGWRIDAMLNNDIVGNSVGQGGVRDGSQVRVFSEGIRASESLVDQVRRRGEGGEDDGPSRALAKLVDTVAATVPRGLDVFVDRRPDRFGRGGDHEAFLREGYPAVRFTSATENWDRQHQNVRVEGGRPYGDTIEGMDFTYLAKVAAINVSALARLASAPSAPQGVTVAGALSRDSTVAWAPVENAASYRVRWRRTDTMDWTGERTVTGAQTAVITQVPVDDHFFGVSAVSASGAESLVSFAGRAPAR